MSSPLLTFRLPDLLASFPWPRNLSEHYCEAKAESSAWTDSFHPFDEEGRRGFNLCDFSTHILPFTLLHLTHFTGRSPCFVDVLS